MDSPDTLQRLGRPVEEARRAFMRLIEPHRPDLWRYCLRLTGSAWDADDLMQETMMRAFARLTWWEPVEARPYLFRIATNAWIDDVRRRRVTPVELDAAEPADEEPDPVETWAAMEHLVAALPPRQRVVLLLTQVFDFTAAEVAAMLHSTEGAVKAALHRARAGLRAAAAGEGPPVGAGLRTRPPADRPPASVDLRSDALGNRLPASGDPQPAAPGERRPTRPTVPVPSAVVAAYLDAFNRRDPDAIAALLTEGAECDIVECGVEYGREVIRKYSLEDWARDPRPQWAEYGELDGEPVVFVYFRTEQHERALGQLVRLTTAGDRSTAMRLYYFTPELIRDAAGRLNVPACTWGYFHQGEG